MLLHQVFIFAITLVIRATKVLSCYLHHQMEPLSPHVAGSRCKWSLFISDPRETDSDSVLSVMSEISLTVAWGTMSRPHACTSGMKRARVHMHALTMIRYQR